MECKGFSSFFENIFCRFCRIRLQKRLIFLPFRHQILVCLRVFLISRFALFSGTAMFLRVKAARLLTRSPASKNPAFSPLPVRFSDRSVYYKTEPSSASSAVVSSVCIPSCYSPINRSSGSHRKLYVSVSTCDDNVFLFKFKDFDAQFFIRFQTVSLLMLKDPWAVECHHRLVPAPVRVLQSAPLSTNASKTIIALHVIDPSPSEVGKCFSLILIAMLIRRAGRLCRRGSSRRAGRLCRRGSSRSLSRLRYRDDCLCNSRTYCLVTFVRASHIYQAQKQYSKDNDNFLYHWFILLFGSYAFSKRGGRRMPSAAFMLLHVYWVRTPYPKAWAHLRLDPELLMF